MTCWKEGRYLTKTKRGRTKKVRRKIRPSRFLHGKDGSRARKIMSLRRVEEMTERKKKKERDKGKCNMDGSF